MKKLLILISLLSTNVFALSLGDNVNTGTQKVVNTTNTRMVLNKNTADHSEYIISTPTGKTTAFVNKSGNVYKFDWNDKSPDISSMVGNKYSSEFKAAYAKRPNGGDHRRLVISTPNLSVMQSGLPGGPFQGSMYAKDLAPNN